jgi:hypothetical protein
MSYRPLRTTHSVLTVYDVDVFETESLLYAPCTVDCVSLLLFLVLQHSSVDNQEAANAY